MYGIQWLEFSVWCPHFYCNHDSGVLFASASELEVLSSAGLLCAVLSVLGGSFCSDTCITSAAAPTGEQKMLSEETYFYTQKCQIPVFHTIFIYLFFVPTTFS